MIHIREVLSNKNKITTKTSGLKNIKLSRLSVTSSEDTSFGIIFLAFFFKVFDVTFPLKLYLFNTDSDEYI